MTELKDRAGGFYFERKNGVRWSMTDYCCKGRGNWSISLLAPSGSHPVNVSHSKGIEVWHRDSVFVVCVAWCQWFVTWVGGNSKRGRTALQITLWTERLFPRESRVSWDLVNSTTGETNLVDPLLTYEDTTWPAAVTLAGTLEQASRQRVGVRKLR